MAAYQARMVSGGRVQIPATLRKKLGLEDGDLLLMEDRDGDLRIWTRAAAIRRAQAMVRQYIPKGVSLVDELIAERRAEAERE